MRKTVYYKAAERIANNKKGIEGPCFCCLELAPNDDDRIKFIELFNPYDGHQAWFGNPYIEENQLARSLALLFMHEMTKK